MKLQSLQQKKQQDKEKQNEEIGNGKNKTQAT